MLAAVECGCPVVEYTPAAVKRAVVGYGRAEKHQVQQMIKLLLGLTKPPSPHDAADALAVAICHLHSVPRRASGDAQAWAAGASAVPIHDPPIPRSADQSRPPSVPGGDYRPPANG